MQTKMFFILLFAATVAMAEDKNKDFDIPVGPKTDIVRETSELKLQGEESVQKGTAPSNFHVGLLAGFAKPKPLKFETTGSAVSYSFNEPLPMITYQVDHFLLQGTTGRWGWTGAVSYGYLQHYEGSLATVLHVLPLDLGLVYRGQWTSTQAVIPYLNLTASDWIYFQRGVDANNTSAYYWYGAATAGLAFNLNKLGLLKSRNETEVDLQYKLLSNNSYVVQLGGTLAL